MKTYAHGERVPAGTYFSVKGLDLRAIVTEGTLSGRPGNSYRRLPILVSVALAPVLGGLFAGAFPTVIFLSFARVVLQSAREARIHRAGEEVPWGLYFGSARPRVRFLSEAQQILIGEDGARFLRVPTWLLIACCPLVGAAFVALFPLIFSVALLRALATPRTS